MRFRSNPSRQNNLLVSSRSNLYIFELVTKKERHAEFLRGAIISVCSSPFPVASLSRRDSGSGFETRRGKSPYGSIEVALTTKEVIRKARASCKFCTERTNSCQTFVLLWWKLYSYVSFHTVENPTNLKIFWF